MVMEDMSVIPRSAFPAILRPVVGDYIQDLGDGRLRYATAYDFERYYDPIN